MRFGDYYHSSFQDIQPLPLHIINFNKPEDWEYQLINLQNKYLSSQSKVLMNTQSVFQVLIELLRDDPVYPDYDLNEALVWDLLQLLPLFLLFYDNDVQEIFGSELNQPIFLQNKQHGRCKTNIQFNDILWHHLKYRAMYEAGIVISGITPSGKYGLQTGRGNFRIALQDFPLSRSGPTFNIRRLPKSNFTINQLVTENQISPQQAKILTEAVQDRKNIIIAGEPGSGKTTLATALLQVLDVSFRVFVVEDASEIVLNASTNPLIQRFHIPSIGEDNREVKRETEIAKILHRSPDYCFLGELQDRVDSYTVFEAFVAGIRGMVTTHARSFTDLLNRWEHSHNLSKDMIASIDVIVLTSRKFSKNVIELGISGLFDPSGRRLDES